jgi:hypothetical protein
MAIAELETRTSDERLDMEAENTRRRIIIATTGGVCSVRKWGMS